MIKHILYPILGSSSVETGMVTAIQVAERFDGHIEAICCRREFGEDLPLIAEEVNLDQFTELARTFDREEKRRISLARKAFDAVRADKGVAYVQHPTSTDARTASWENIVGDPYRAVAERAGAADLVVIGRTEEGVGALTRGVVETALFGSGAPVLLAAKTPRETLGEKILIGWNRSASSARAVRNALPLLRGAAQVRIIMVATGAKIGPEPARIANFLALHGIAATVREIPPDYRKVSEVLLEEAVDMGADLVVAGAFSHSRLREIVLGGVTRDILADGSVPVLMTH
ncbi:MAG: universal stress protein [Alphaproteobacteria bacterium]